MASLSTQLENVLEPGFVPATRIQQSLVATLERNTLAYLAARTPSSISSDHLTVLGFVSQCSAGICYGLARWHPRALLIGIPCLALNWLGDSLDGTLARVRCQERPRYGFYVDHISDTIAAFFLMGGLAVSGYVHPAVAFGMLVAFLMLSIEVYLAAYTLGDFQLSHGKLGPTEIRILLAVGNLALLHHPRIELMGRRILLFDAGGAVAIGGMAAMLLAAAVKHTAQLYREERLR
ncbi:MAG TPA: CDP-alcohol phosphatidyltransferase family protein [Terriglobales bacterium]|nr:CDP-alcohol phosphatidyltransferase family protein [Terriglobales bacterium]